MWLVPRISLYSRTNTFTSGKSSLILTLLRMTDITSGTVFIDGVDISSIPRQEVRKRLNVLPQEPFFLQGTLRENVDPFSVASDELITAALADVGMWSKFESCGGLDGTFDPKILSEGQRQLVCIARSMLQKSSILVMDEPTSSTDANTDTLLQGLFQTRFRTQTVVTVVHKLETILAYDRVILLHNGQISEVGDPRHLLAMPGSALRKLYESQGKSLELQKIPHSSD